MAVILSLSELYSPVDNLPVWSAGGGDGGWSGDLRHWHKPQPRWSSSRSRGWRLVIVIVILFWNRNYFWHLLHCNPTIALRIILLIHLLQFGFQLSMYICTIPYNVKMSPKEKYLVIFSNRHWPHLRLCPVPFSLTHLWRWREGHPRSRSLQTQVIITNAPCQCHTHSYS